MGSKWEYLQCNDQIYATKATSAAVKIVGTLFFLSTLLHSSSIYFGFHIGILRLKIKFYGKSRSIRMCFITAIKSTNIYPTKYGCLYESCSIFVTMFHQIYSIFIHICNARTSHIAHRTYSTWTITTHDKIGNDYKYHKWFQHNKNEHCNLFSIIMNT